MEFSQRLDALQQRVATAKADVQAAATESREQRAPDPCRGGLTGRVTAPHVSAKYECRAAGS
jgi:hypothetical protein